VELDALLRWMNQAFPIRLQKDQVEHKTAEEVRDFILDKVKRAYEAQGGQRESRRTQGH